MLLHTFYKWEDVGSDKISGYPKVTSWQVTDSGLKGKPPDSQSIAPFAARKDMVLNPFVISEAPLWTQTCNKSLSPKSNTSRVGRAHRVWNFMSYFLTCHFNSCSPSSKWLHWTTSCSHYSNNVFCLFVCLSFMRSMYVYDRKQIQAIKEKNQSSINHIKPLLTIFLCTFW